jgi:hypothetical protein
MATVNKNFRIKQGLIVEGTTGTINGQNILTETGADNYILNLVGGATLVKSVEATQLEVNGAGKLSVKSGVFDPAGSAAAAQSAAEATAAADATSKANAAQAAAITAAATDATTKVAAEAALRVSGDAASVSTAAADATSKANAAQAAAEATAAADATSKANAAQAAAEATAAADATSKANAAQAAAEATAEAANTAQQNGTTAFTALNVNDQAKQIAASSTSLGSVVVTAYEWPKADYRSGKFLVKIDNGTHNEISEILLTLDSSDNVAITEYAIVGTNGSRGSITAIVSGANVQIRVNPVNDSTIKVTGTLLK